MRNFFNNLSYRLANFMQGRYGNDEFNRFLSIAALVFIIASFFGRFWAPLLYFYIAGLLILIFEIYRSLSKNYTARERERNAYLKIAGNINKDLVQNIHDHIKEKIDITATPPKKILTLKDEQSSVVDYYLKSKINEPENGIAVLYEIPQEYLEYFKIFKECFESISMNYLRFNYINGYSPLIRFEGRLFIIIEQGLYKEVDSMEDDINKVLLDVIEGRYWY